MRQCADALIGFTKCDVPLASTISVCIIIHMNYVIIRNLKSDKLTMHAVTCSVAVKHYGKMVDAASYETKDEAILDTAFHGTKVKTCACAK